MRISKQGKSLTARVYVYVLYPLHSQVGNFSFKRALWLVNSSKQQVAVLLLMGGGADWVLSVSTTLRKISAFRNAGE